MQEQYAMRYIPLIILFTLACCSSENQSKLPYFNSPDFTPQFLTPAEASEKITHVIPAFSFTDQNNKTITQSDVKGKIYVADFFFTRCAGICPKMTANMSKVAAAFSSDKEIVILSHSVTPESDSVAALKKYAAAKNIDQSNWHLLTGDKGEIYTIARKGYFADERLGFSKDTTAFLHTENFILVDRHGRIRGVYNGTLELETDNLIQHIRILKKED
jgi:protein SCO1/2